MGKYSFLLAPTIFLLYAQQIVYGLDPLGIALQAPQQQGPAISTAGLKALAAGLAFGLATFGAGIAVGRAAAATIAATAEKAEMKTIGIIMTALGEALAIYGIVMSILILGQPG